MNFLSFCRKNGVTGLQQRKIFIRNPIPKEIVSVWR